MLPSKRFLIISLSIIFLSSVLIKPALAAGRRLEVQIPGLTSTTLPALPEYIVAIYNFSLLAIGVVCLGALIYGGFRYISSVGSPAAISDAKDQIFSAFLGLIILLGAWLLLNTINPDLVILTSQSGGCNGDFNCLLGDVCDPIKKVCVSELKSFNWQEGKCFSLNTQVDCESWVIPLPGVILQFCEWCDLCSENGKGKDTSTRGVAGCVQVGKCSYECVEGSCGTTSCSGCTGPICPDRALYPCGSDVPPNPGCTGPCETGTGCPAGENCISGVCVGSAVCTGAKCPDLALYPCGTYVPPNPGCTDPCPSGTSCPVGHSCVADICVAVPVCTGPRCQDRALFPCGDYVPANPGCTGPCLTGTSCPVGESCVSGECTAGTCTGPTCPNLVNFPCGSYVQPNPGCVGPCPFGTGCPVGQSCASGTCILSCTGAICPNLANYPCGSTVSPNPGCVGPCPFGTYCPAGLTCIVNGLGAYVCFPICTGAICPDRANFPCGSYVQPNPGCVGPCPFGTYCPAGLTCVSGTCSP